MQTVQVQLWLATLFSNFPKGSTNIPYGKSPGLFSSSSCTFFCCLQYGVPHGHKPSWRTEQRALGRGSSLESLHSLHKCLKRVMPTLHLPCPSPSYTVYFLFRHPLGGGSSPQMCAVNLGTFGGLDRALLLGGPIIHQHLQMPIGNRWLSQLQQQVFVLFFFLCLTLSSCVLCFKLGIGKQF